MCIVGAGPAGLVVAHLLRQAGVSFVVLERQPLQRLRARMKAGMIEHRTVELLRAHGLAESILERGRRLGSCEFRVDGEAFVLDYASLCGHGHWIYPQQELVGDWVEQLLAAGCDVRFGIEARSVLQDEGGAAVAAVGSGGSSLTVECELVACCDGAASVFSPGMSAAAVAHPFRWLSLIANVAPSSEGTIYGLHRHGFAGQMHRSATMTRFMLEVPTGDGYDDWPDQRIWAELQDRLAVTSRPSLTEGEFVERDILDHRVRVCEPMQHGRLFLVGDAAHLITPAGGKGMNIAIQDAVELAGGIREQFGDSDESARLARYSETRLPHVWRQQEFSNLMLSLFNAGTGVDDQTDDGKRFSYGLRRARLDQVINDPSFSHWFAREYVGIDD